MLLSVWLALLGAVQCVELTQNAQSLFTESMQFLDHIYDPAASYLNYFFFPLAAGAHETRSSVWYSVGLLQRNQGTDAEEAASILRNVIGDQEKNVSAQWFGDYTKYPEQPTVGSVAYDPKIYSTWDPNWRGFIGTALIIIYEEFSDILPSDISDLLLESVYNSTVGDSYRVGGVDSDNLYAAYSNPWLMRSVASTWTGLQFDDANMTSAGNDDADAFLELFDRNHTLSEYNGPTYAGVSIYALTIAAKYLGTTNTTIGRNAARLVSDIWDYESQLWHPGMRNLAGPWDRSYGYDMNKYVGIFSIWIWTLLGRDKAWTTPSPIWTLAHADDFEFAPVFAVLSEFHGTLLSDSALSRLTSLEEHTYTGHTYAPPADNEERNVTTWLSSNLTIGTFSFNQRASGGFSEDRTSYSPSVIQWSRSDDSVGYFNLYPTMTKLEAGVAPYELNLTYTQDEPPTSITFVLSTNPLGKTRDITGFSDVDGLGIKVVGGSVDPSPIFSFCGLLGGECNDIHGFEFWNVTFAMPEGSTEVPSIQLQFEVR